MGERDCLVKTWAYLISGLTRTTRFQNDPKKRIPARFPPDPYNPQTVNYLRLRRPAALLRLDLFSARTFSSAAATSSSVRSV